MFDDVGRYYGIMLNVFDLHIYSLLDIYCLFVYYVLIVSSMVLAIRTIMVLRFNLILLCYVYLIFVMGVPMLDLFVLRVIDIMSGTLILLNACMFLYKIYVCELSKDKNVSVYNSLDFVYVNDKVFRYYFPSYTRCIRGYYCLNAPALSERCLRGSANLPLDCRRLPIIFTITLLITLQIIFTVFFVSFYRLNSLHGHKLRHGCNMLITKYGIEIGCLLIVVCRVFVYLTFRYIEVYILAFGYRLEVSCYCAECKIFSKMILSMKSRSECSKNVYTFVVMYLWYYFNGNRLRSDV